MTPPDLFELLRDVLARLDSIGVPYVIGGSMASSLHGEPRGSLDIDFVIELTIADIGRFSGAFADVWYVSEPAMHEAVLESRSFNAIHPESGLKVDFFVRGDSAFDREEFQRRSWQLVHAPSQLHAFVKTPEDSILRKLLWYRDGGGTSSQQWRDVLGVLAVRGAQLDQRYLDAWSERLGLTELLTRARRESSG